MTKEKYFFAGKIFFFLCFLSSKREISGKDADRHSETQTA